MTSRTDAKGQQTQYDYDSYGRVTEVRHYPTQGSEDVHQRVDYTYDQGQNGMGRLTGVSFGRNDFLEVPAPALGYVYVYNQAGRVISQEMLTPVFNPANPQYPTVLNLTAAYQWDNEGRMTSTGYPAATWPGWGVQPAPVYTYQYDNMGRLSGMTEDIFDGNGPLPVVSAGYGPAGEMLSLSYFGVNETRTYNSLLQLTRMTAVPGYGANLMDMQYNYSATQNNGRITSSNDYVTGENVSYTYDVVNRLTGASAGSMWGETYSYDGFGNLTGKNVTQAPAPVLGVSYDANNHQLGLTYDANGNQTWDAQNTTGYGWDVENRLAISASPGWPYAETWYSYDPWGRRVMKDANADPWGLNGGPGYVGGTWEYYFYGVTGQRLATVLCNSNNYPLCAVEGYNVYFGGKLVAKRSNGTWIRSSPVVTDRLGSVRAVQAPWPGSTTSMSYFPWGEERTVTADGAEKFGTYFRDGAGQDYAEQRYYNNGTGRFWSVDPGGMGTAHPADPGSWNRYAYVAGDPINQVDPRGTDWVCVGSYDDESCYWDSTGEGGGGAGTVGDDGTDQTVPIKSPPKAAPWHPLKVDQGTNGAARGLLRNAFESFGGSNCDKVFGQAIGSKYTTAGYEAEATKANFYNVTDQSYSGLTQNQVSHNFSSATISTGTFTGQNQDATAITIGGSTPNPAVLLGAEFFSNTNTVFQTDVLLHELIHALTGWSDAAIFANFAQYGLTMGQFGDTEDISAWISTDCKSTPTSMTWWNQ